MHGLSWHWWGSDATSNATGYDIPPLLCCVVQSRDTVHVSASSLSPHLQPEGGREEGGETKEGGEGKGGYGREKGEWKEEGVVEKGEGRGSTSNITK